MGRIIGYQYDNDIKDDDAWIGTEATSRRTKQYTAQAVADYLNINGSISIVGQMTYKYVVTPESETGSFAIFGGGPDPVAFSAVTKLTLSNTDVSGQRVVEFLELLVNSDILISRQSEISTFGYYSIDSYAVNATNSDYYDLSVTFKSGNGSMEADKIYETQNFTLAAEENISTLQTTIDAGNTYQESPLNTLWTWGTDAITATSTSFTSLLSGKRFKTTFIGSGSYTDVLPNSINFYNSLDSLTTLTSSSTAVAAAITLELPSSSGTLALTTDIIDSPWDTVLGGINYAGGNVGIGTTGPLAKLHVFGGSAIIGDDDFNAVKISSGTSGTTYNTIGNGFIAPNVNFNINNQTKLAINGNTGNVGIGTTSPGEKLEVNGNISVVDEGEIYIKGSTSTRKIVRLDNTNDKGLITLDRSDDTKVSISSDFGTHGHTYFNGLNVNVGIGTTSPSSPLDVATVSSGPVAKFVNTSGTGGAGVVIQAGVTSSSSILTLSDYQNNERLRVRGDGNVGIGTTSPSAKLEVVDSGNISLINARKDLATTAFTSTYNAIQMSNFDSTANNWAKFSFAGNPSIPTQTAASIATQFTDHWNNYGDLAFWTRGSANFDERMRITSDGNVGIGTTSPAEKLHIKGQVRFQNNTNGNQGAFGIDSAGAYFGSYSNVPLRFILQNGVTTPLYINTSGNVGIGTTSPTRKLTVNGDIGVANNGKLFLWDDHDSNYFQYYRWQLNSSLTAYINNSGSGGVALKTAGNTRLHINYAGNVGIGTTTPANKLTVNGPIEAINSNGPTHFIARFDSTYFTTYTTDSVRFDGTGQSYNFIQNGTNRMSINSAGNVGIGTTSPSQKLQVAGNIYTTGSIRIENGGNQLEFGNANVAMQRTSNLLELGGYDGIVFKSSNTVLDSQSERMRITSSGNVGIGTTSPSQKLQVVSDSIIMADFTTTGTKGGIKISEADEGGFLSTEANRICLGSAIGVSSSNLTYHMGTNNLGIGTASPSYKLTVDSGTTDQIARFTSTDVNSKISLEDDTSISYWNLSAGTTSIGSNSAVNSSNLNIDSSGNVGIGTTSPSTPLDVRGDITIRNANGGNPVDAGSLYFTEAGNTWGTDIYGFRINQEGSASYLQFQSSVAATVIDILTLARNTGNVGIGTTSPSEKLDVVGNIKVRGTNNLTISSTSSGGDFNLSSGIRGYKFSNNNGDLVSITSNGNVGIGTTSPSVTLDVASDNPKIRLTDTDGGIAALEGNLGNLILIADNGNTEADSRVAFKVDGSEKMRITSDGNVGVGTTSPVSKLEVDGGDIEVDDSASGLILRSPDGTRYRITVANGGTLTVTAV